MSDNDTTTRTGQLAEDQAARFLEDKQLTVVARNHRCRGGEIDLICQDGQTLVFVEVRLRRNGNFGGAAASITPVKQGRIVRAARHYLLTKGKSDCDCRFDCVLLDGKGIEWIRDAFSA
jgi:putative endonuclease